MKVAVVGSRGYSIADLGRYLPPETTEIISGGARGIDASAKTYALEHGLRLTEFLPQYDRFGRGAPLRRNFAIVNCADLVLAFWDGISRGTKHVIELCKNQEIPLRIYSLPEKLDR